MNRAAVAGVGVVVVLGAAYLGATAWSGQQTQARYHEQMARAQARLPFIRISEEKFDKGFFTSTSTTTLRFGCASATDKDGPSVTVISTIHHGPLADGSLAAAVIDSQLRISSAALQQAVAAFGGVPLTMRTVVGFAGNASSTFASPPASVPVGSGGAVVWQGMTGSLESSSDARSVSYRVKSPGLSFADPGSHASLRIGALAFQGDGTATNDSGLIMVGKAQGTLEAMEIADGNADHPFKAAFTGMKFSSDTSLDGDLLGGSGTFSGAASVGDVKIDRFEMQSSMKRLHAPTYQRLMQTASNQIYRCDSKDKLADLLALQTKMQDDLIAMLRYNPEVSLDKLAVDSGGQRGEVSYGIGVEGVTEADAHLPIASMLMTHARAKASARLPIEWLRKLSQAGAARLHGTAPDPATVDVMLDQAQAQGYVVRDGDYVKSNVDFAKGVLTVNGKAVGPGGPGADAANAGPGRPAPPR
jgi:uncharacterized protein YdgA (DUF945 family)